MSLSFRPVARPSAALAHLRLVGPARTVTISIPDKLSCSPMACGHSQSLLFARRAPFLALNTSTQDPQPPGSLGCELHDFVVYCRFRTGLGRHIATKIWVYWCARKEYQQKVERAQAASASPTEPVDEATKRPAPRLTKKGGWAERFAHPPCAGETRHRSGSAPAPGTRRAPGTGKWHQKRSTRRASRWGA